MQTHEPVLAISSAPDEATARRLANTLLEARVAACVNLLPGAASLYWWKGQIESTHEWLMLIKTTRERCAELKLVLCQAHPYEVLELIVLRIDDGLPAYLEWMVREASAQTP